MGLSAVTNLCKRTYYGVWVQRTGGGAGRDVRYSLIVWFYGKFGYSMSVYVGTVCTDKCMCITDY
jgi:hypothetical protein